MAEEFNTDPERTAAEEASGVAESAAQQPVSEPAGAKDSVPAPEAPKPSAPTQPTSGAQAQPNGYQAPARPAAAPAYPPQQAMPASGQAPYGNRQPYAGGYMPYPPQPVYAAAPVPPPAPAAPATPKKQHNWARTLGLVLLVLLIALAAFGIGSCAGMVTSTVNSSLDPNGHTLATLDEDAIAVITISGEIGYNGSSSSPEGFKMLLDQAEKNDHVKAVLLRVNSGGGSATAGEEMAAYLREFSKPVVVSSASVNASAAYEISSQADYIFVNKSTEIGSIGTIIQFTDYSDLLDKLGIKSDNIASSDSKDSSYGTRELTDEEREYYQQLVDQINQVFIENVAEGRNMSIEDVKKLATGMVFSGVDAVDNGIADEIGTREDAAKKAAELGGLDTDNYKEVSLTLGSSSSFTSILDLLGSSASDPLETSEILEDGYNGGNAE